MANEWGEKFGDFNQEPKKVFVNFLIFNMRLIEMELFSGGRASKAVQQLRGLICSLDTASKETLKPQLKKLREWDAGKAYYKNDVELLYDQVCSHLHIKYLKEMNFARPKYRGDTLEVPQE